MLMDKFDLIEIEMYVTMDKFDVYETTTKQQLNLHVKTVQPCDTHFTFFSLGGENMSK